MRIDRLPDGDGIVGMNQREQIAHRRQRILIGVAQLREYSRDPLRHLAGFVLLLSHRLYLFAHRLLMRLAQQASRIEIHQQAMSNPLGNGERRRQPRRFDAEQMNRRATADALQPQYEILVARALGKNLRTKAGVPG